MKTMQINDSIMLEFARCLKEELGDRLVHLILYGSYARGDMDEGSDYDFLVVFKEYEDFWKVFHLVDPIASDVSFRYDTLISALPMRLEEYLNRKSPLLLNIRREGIIIE